MSNIKDSIDQAELKEKLARAVCLFLAEMLRTRRLDLGQSTEIAARVVQKLDQIESELHFMEVVKDLELKFQEIKILEEDLTYLFGKDERERMEGLVRQYAITNLPDNPEAAVEIMEEALLPETTLEVLKQKFEGFAKFVSTIKN